MKSGERGELMRRLTGKVPGLVTDNRAMRANGTSGLQDSAVGIDDDGRLVNAAGLRMALPFGFPTTASGANRRLQTAGGAIGGDANSQGYTMPIAGSVIGIGMTVDINSYSSGDVKGTAIIDGSSALECTVSSPGVADGQHASATASQGTHTFAANSQIGAQRTNTGTCTTDDVTILIIVEFDA